MNPENPEDQPEGALFFKKGSVLPGPMGEALASTLSSGMVSLPSQIFVAVLNDYRPSDAKAFLGRTRFRVGLCRSFIILSLKSKGLNFDVIWSPVIAALSGESNMDQPEAGEHPLFSFILVDGKQIIRAIRQATISPDCAMAIWRAQTEIRERNVSAADIQLEMQYIFAKYPQSIPDGFFHEVCDLGD